MPFYKKFLPLCRWPRHYVPHGNFPLTIWIWCLHIKTAQIPPWWLLLTQWTLVSILNTQWLQGKKKGGFVLNIVSMTYSQKMGHFFAFLEVRICNVKMFFVCKIGCITNLQVKDYLLMWNELKDNLLVRAYVMW